MADKREDEMWFAPKCLGYGAGLPIAWQGWAMLAVHAAVILIGVPLLHPNEPAVLAWVLIFAVLPLPLYAAKTRGGWKWRWPGRRGN